MWCDGSLHLAYIVTKNVMEDELNTRLGYAMVWLYNIQNTSTTGVIGYRRVWKIMCSEWIDWVELSIQLNVF